MNKLLLLIPILLIIPLVQNVDAVIPQETSNNNFIATANVTSLYYGETVTVTATSIGSYYDMGAYKTNIKGKLLTLPGTNYSGYYEYSTTVTSNTSYDIEFTFWHRACSNCFSSDWLHLTVNYYPYPRPVEATDPPEISSSSSGGCADCTAPTLGMDRHGRDMVTDGWIFNGIPLYVDYYKTNMPLQNTEIGVINNLQLKIYENQGPHNIEMVQFGVGIKEVGIPFSESQAHIEINVNNTAHDIYNPQLGTIKVIDPDGILDLTDVRLSLTECNGGVYLCLQVNIDYSYLKSPDYPYLMTYIWDVANNASVNFFNDGVDVTGGIIEIPEEEIPYKYVCKDKPLSESMGQNRNNCNFRALMPGIYQQ